VSDLFLEDDELADEPEVRPRRRLRTALLVVLAVIVVVAAGAGGAAWWVQQRLDPPGEAGEQVAFVVGEGASTTAIADQLEAEGIIADARVFRVYLRLEGQPTFQAGSYELRRDSTVWDVRAALEAGPAITYTRLTVPEGLRLEEIAERVDLHPRFTGDAFRAAIDGGAVRSAYQPGSVDTLEGLLLPETYTIDERQDEAALLRTMVSSLDAAADAAGVADAAARVGISPYEAIVVASLIEEEARVPEDRAKIARVIYNRLDDGMRLQIDASVIYALGQRREDGRVLFSDLEVDSPYNTYRNEGLPPTPIAAPGRASLEAALNPAEGDWRFYVKYEDDGTHAFSRTYEEHQRRIAEAKDRGVLPR